MYSILTYNTVAPDRDPLNLVLFSEFRCSFSQAELGPVLAKANEHGDEDESQKATSPFNFDDEERAKVKDGSNCDFAVPIRGPQRTQTAGHDRGGCWGGDPTRPLRFRLWRSVMSP